MLTFSSHTGWVGYTNIKCVSWHIAFDHCMNGCVSGGLKNSEEEKINIKHVLPCKAILKKLGFNTKIMDGVWVH